jgi:hypothetical protein
VNLAVAWGFGETWYGGVKTILAMLEYPEIPFPLVFYASGTQPHRFLVTAAVLPAPPGFSVGYVF